MFTIILNTIQGLLGFYLVGGERRLAISQNYAIDRDVFGLEAVVCVCGQTTTKYMGSAKTRNYVVKVYLTQHEGANNTLEQAIEALSDLGYQVSVSRYPISKQGNLMRAVVVINTNCLC